MRKMYSENQIVNSVNKAIESGEISASVFPPEPVFTWDGQNHSLTVEWDDLRFYPSFIIIDGAKTFIFPSVLASGDIQNSQLKVYTNVELMPTDNTLDESYVSINITNNTGKLILNFLNRNTEPQISGYGFQFAKFNQNIDLP